MLHWQVSYFQTLLSTQTQLKSQAKLLTEGQVMVATVQEAGLGRKGDPWNSQRGGLYASFLLKPSQLLNELPLVLLRAIYQVLAQMIDSSLQVKWPNDLLFQGKKLSGLLIDSQVTGFRPDHYICGFGVNINQAHFPDGLPACSLFQITGNSYSIRLVLAEILMSFEEHYEQYLLNKEDFCHQSVSLLPWLEYNEHIEKLKV